MVLKFINNSKLCGIWNVSAIATLDDYEIPISLLVIIYNKSSPNPFVVEPLDVGFFKLEGFKLHLVSMKEAMMGTVKAKMLVYNFKWSC